MLQGATVAQLLRRAEEALESDDLPAFKSLVESVREALVGEEAAGTEQAAEWAAELGRLLHSAGDHEQALEYLAAALDSRIERHGAGSQQVATTRRVMAAAKLALGLTDDALMLLEQAAASTEDSIHARIERAMACSLLAELYCRLQRPRQALAVLRRIAEFLSDGVESMQSLVDRAEDTLGAVFLQLDRLDAAEYHLERTVARHGGPSGDPLDYASWLWQLAQLYGRQHRFDYAVEAAGRCVQIREQGLSPTDARLGQAHLVLAGVLAEGTDWVRARAHFHRALTILQAAGAPSPYEYFLAYSGLLHSAVKMGEIDDPETDLQSLLDLGAAMGPDADLGIVQPLIDLALIKAQRGDTVASRELAQRAHRAGGRAQASEVLRLSFLDLARLHIRQNNVADAVDVLDRVAKIDRAVATRLVATRHFAQRIIYSDTLAQATTEFVNTILNHLPDDPAAATIALRVVLERKALFTDADIAHARADDALRGLGVDDQLDRIDALRRELREIEVAGPIDGHRKLWSALDAKKRQLRVAQSQLDAMLEDPPQLCGAPAIDPDAVRQCLDADEALIEFFALRTAEADSPLQRSAGESITEVRPERFVALVLPGGRGHCRLIDLGPAEVIDRLVYSFIVAVHPAGEAQVPRDRLSDLERGDERAIGSRLRQVVFDPIVPAIDGCSRLRVAPDGAVAAVPFAMLPAESGGRLVDQYEISYLSCGRALLTEMASRPAASSPPLIVTDPDFDVVDLEPMLSAHAQPPDFYFERLPRSASEGQRVYSRIGGVHRTGPEAAKSLLLQAKAPAILHIATHGYYLPAFGRGVSVIGDWRRDGRGLSFRGDVLSFAEEPLLRSGLAFAGVNAQSAGLEAGDETGDGLVTALDVSRLDLRGTQLVVLSACSTARGNVRLGEGSAGLLHAFEVAGARTVLAALWAVADHPATVSFVDRVYAEMVLSGRRKPAALRAAQRELDRLGAPAWVWGAFVSYGDATALDWQRPGD